MVKVEFTGSVEEVKKEIREFIEVNSTGVTTEELTTAIKSSLETEAKAEEKTSAKIEKKKETVKKIEEAPTQKLPTAPAKKEEAPVELSLIHIFLIFIKKTINRSSYNSSWII